jgi:hypothetical protein
MMIEIAASQAAFTAVLVLVGLVALVVSVIVLVRHRDPFRNEPGEFWMEHGSSDHTPHDMPGARYEDRHVIDPLS